MKSFTLSVLAAGVLGLCLGALAAHAYAPGPSKMLTGTGSSRVTIPADTTTGLDVQRWQAQFPGSAAIPIWCEYGYLLADGGTKSLMDGGQPLVATIGGTGDYFVFPGDPVPFVFPKGGGIVACTAEDGGTKNINFRRITP